MPSLLLLLACLGASEASGSLSWAKGEAGPESSWLNHGSTARASGPRLTSNHSIAPHPMGDPDLSFQSRTSLSPASEAAHSASSSSLSWGGTAASSEEVDKISVLRLRLSKVDSSGLSSWIERCQDVEILRFLRHHGGKVEETMNALVEHAKWRISQYFSFPLL